MRCGRDGRRKGGTAIEYTVCMLIIMIVLIFLEQSLLGRWTILILVVLVAVITSIMLLIRQLAEIVRMRAESAVLNLLSDDAPHSPERISEDIARGGFGLRKIYVRGGAVTDALAALTRAGRIRYKGGMYYSLEADIPAATARPIKKIFLCYRRTDSEDIVGRIYQDLAKEFDESFLFKDVDDIPAGEAFGEYIQAALQEAEVLIAVIGKDWLARGKAGRRRLEEPDDYVRIEIETAIRNNLRIIPVIVSGAAVPLKDDLPESIRRLPDLQSIPIRPDPDYSGDLRRLLAQLKYRK